MDGRKKDKKEARTRIYAAYGSNLNIAQMYRRCPKAKVAGKAELKGWRMEFRGGTGSGVATIVRDENSSVPVGLWRTTAACEAALDRYEGYPCLYRKESVSVEFEGRETEAYVYIMNEGRPLSRPSLCYYNTIAEGYVNFSFDKAALDGFVDNTLKELKV